MCDERFVISDMAVNGLEAFDLVTRNPKKYDVIILDLNMPKMSGIQFLEQLSKHRITAKVLIVSTIAKEGAAETIRCLELGAFDFVTKPDNIRDTQELPFKERVLEALTAAIFSTKTTTSTQKTVSPSTNSKGLDASSNASLAKTAVDQMLLRMQSRNTNDLTATSSVNESKAAVSFVGKKVLIALACSTGGPKALHSVVPYLPKHLAAPVVIVQHMPYGFTESLAARLNEVSPIAVKEAADGDIIKRGNVYIAKGGSQLRINRQGKEYGLAVTQEPPRGGLRPCADIMYESLLDSDFDVIVCVVLTGMGSDGTLGIQKLKAKKQVYVIAQDEATSTVYGMPKAIKEAGLTDEVHELSKIAQSITKIVGV